MDDNRGTSLGDFACYLFLIAALVVGFAWHQFDRTHPKQIDCTPKSYEHGVWFNADHEVVGQARTEDSVIIWKRPC